MANTTQRPYHRIITLIERHGGEMTFRPMGAGGDWVIQLHGRTKTVPCRDRTVNALDRLYVPLRPAPQTWEDYADDAPLVDDAFWGLVNLVQGTEAT